MDGQLKNVLPSETIKLELKRCIERLQKEERQILDVGAVQGRHFMSTVLERLLTKQKHEMMEYLLDIEGQHLLISQRIDEESREIRSDVYTFVQSLMQQSIYKRLPPGYRSNYHREIAKILEEILKDVLNRNPQSIAQRKLVIQIAQHYNLGDEPFSAAYYYLQAAQSTFYNGALKETSELCQLALEKVRSLPECVADSDKLRAEIIQLKLVASEMWWRAKPGSGH